MSFIGPLIGLGRALIGEAAVDQILTAFFGGGQGKEITALEKDVQALAGLDTALAKLLGSLTRNVDQLWVTVHDLGADEKKGWLGSENTQNAIGVSLDAMSQDFSGAIIRIVDDYVPNTITNTLNAVKRDWINDIYAIFSRVLTRLDNDEAAIGQLKSWRSNTVDPDLRRLDTFLSFWNSWPVQVVTQLHNWINAPDSWADFLMHSIVTRMTTYGLDPNRQPSTDDLMRMFWTRSPDVFRYVEDGLTQVLLSPFP